MQPERRRPESFSRGRPLVTHACPDVAHAALRSWCSSSCVSVAARPFRMYVQIVATSKVPNTTPVMIAGQMLDFAPAIGSYRRDSLLPDHVSLTSGASMCSGTGSI